MGFFSNKGGRKLTKASPSVTLSQKGHADNQITAIDHQPSQYVSTPSPQQNGLDLPSRAPSSQPSINPSFSGSNFLAASDFGRAQNRPQSHFSDRHVPESRRYSSTEQVYFSPAPGQRFQGANEYQFANTPLDHPLEQLRLGEENGEGSQNVGMWERRPEFEAAGGFAPESQGLNQSHTPMPLEMQPTRHELSASVLINEDERHVSRKHQMVDQPTPRRASKVLRKPVPARPYQPPNTAATTSPPALEQNRSRLSLPIHPHPGTVFSNQKNSSQSAWYSSPSSSQSFRSEGTHLQQTEHQWFKESLHALDSTSSGRHEIQSGAMNPTRSTRDPSIANPSVLVPELPEISTVGTEIPIGGPEWHQKCLNHFYAKYRQRLMPENWKNEPLRELFDVPPYPYMARSQLPPHLYQGSEEIMPHLLNDRLFYLALLIVQSCARQYSCYLWEMFGTNPGHLIRICMAFSSANRPLFLEPDDNLVLPLGAWLKFVITGTDEQKDHQSFESLLHDIEASLKTRNTVASPYFMELSFMKAKLLELKDEHREFSLENAWEWTHNLEHHNESSEKVLGNPYFPLYNGLQTYLALHKDHLLEGLLQESLSKIPYIPVLPQDADARLISEPNPASLGPLPRILFDTAGTGKSRTIQNTMRRYLGFYFVAPNLPPLSTDAAESLLEASRAGASQDTFSAYTDLSKFEGSGLRVRILPLASGRSNDQISSLQSIFLNRDSIAHPLIVARLGLLEKFMQATSQDKATAETKWTQIQTSCDMHGDPFDVAHRFFRLQNPTRWHIWRQNTFPIYFVDEAQRAIGDPLAEDILFGILSEAYGSRLISGTSLKLEQMRNFLKLRFPSEHDREVYRISLRHKYIVDEVGFYKALKGYLGDILREVYELALVRHTNSADVSQNLPLLARGAKALGFPINLPMGQWEYIKITMEQCLGLQGPNNSHISAEYTKFLGRIRWMTIFAEELLRISSENEWYIDGSHIKKASERAQKTIKESLKRQIDRIKNSNWIDDLFWTAINVDVFSKARIFESRDSSQLISEGFALVHEDSDGNGPVVLGRLQEPLAVEAVMEYLRNSPDNLYEKLMNRFFATLQLDNADQGGIGKYAEFIFTSKLDHFLREPSESDEVAKDRRSKFNNVIANAKRYEVQNNSWENIDSSGFEKFYLSHTGVKVDLFQEQMSIGHWLMLEAQGEMRPTFLFPPKDEGPDLVFFLKDKYSGDKVLCMIQYKTGIGQGQPGKLLQAVKSLVKPWDPQNLNNINQYQGRVIHIVVANMVEIRSKKTFTDMFDLIKPTPTTKDGRIGDLWETLRNNFRLDTPIPGARKKKNHRYICFLDKKDSEEVWGLSFQYLLELMKTGTSKKP